MRQSLVIGASCCLLAIAWSCRDKPIGVDPCSGVPVPPTDFKMYTVLKQRSNSGIKDTFRVPEDIERFYYHSLLGVDESIDIYFEASPNADSVRWKIGTDTRVFSQRKFFLKFQSAVDKIEVRLIQRRPPNRICFPNDDGIDTLYKTFYVANGEITQPILGQFKGYIIGSERDTFTVTTHYFATTPGLEGYYFIKNLPKGNSAIVGSSFPRAKGDVIYTLGNKFGFETSYGFGEIYREGLEYALGTVQKDSLIIKYELTGSRKGTFIGIRQK
jgi:hypothetical protein